MVTFESKVTKNGNLKVSSQLREILGLYGGKRVIVTLDYTDPDEIKIPQEILDEAGICADNGLEIYTDEGQIIIQEPTIKKSIGKWKKVKKIFFAKKHSKASYLQIAGLRYKN